jgi:hypothetical protein
MSPASNRALSPFLAASFALLLACPAAGRAQSAPPAPPSCRTDSVELALRRVPPVRVIAGGLLTVHNVFRAQGLQLLHAHERPVPLTVDSLVSEAFVPHQALWAAYLGDEAAFRTFSTRFLRFAGKVSCERLPVVLAADITGRFERVSEWLTTTTGTAPRGSWYFVYGHAATDMGGLGGLRMVADLSQLDATPGLLDNLVPHELAHMVYDRRPGAAEQPLTVLGRIVAEGIATYASFVEGRGARSPADVVGYSKAEWEWAIAHEAALRERVAAMLCATVPATIDSVASRRISVMDGAPTAIGYVLGFRLVERYVAQRRRPGAWVELFRLSPAEVAMRSRYFGRSSCNTTAGRPSSPTLPTAPAVSP